MVRYNLYRCRLCSRLLADAGKPDCPDCSGRSGQTTVERLDPDDLGVFPARDR